MSTTIIEALFVTLGLKTDGYTSGAAKANKSTDDMIAKQDELILKQEELDAVQSQTTKKQEGRVKASDVLNNTAAKGEKRLDLQKMLAAKAAKKRAEEAKKQEKEKAASEKTKRQEQKKVDNDEKSRLTAKTQTIKTLLNAAGLEDGAVGGLMRSLGTFGGGLMVPLAAAATAGLALKKILTSVAEIADNDARFGRFSANIGMSTQALDAQAKVATLTGGKVEEAMQGAAELSMELTNLKHKGEMGGMIEAMMRFGVSVVDANGQIKDQKQLTLDLAKQLENRTDMSREDKHNLLAGWGVNDTLINEMLKGTKAYKALIDEQERISRKTPEQIKQAELISEKNKQMKVAWIHTKESIGNWLTGFVYGLYKVPEAVGDIANGFKVLKYLLSEDFSAGLTWLEDMFKRFDAWIDTLGKKWEKFKEKAKDDPMVKSVVSTVTETARDVVNFVSEGAAEMRNRYNGNGLTHDKKQSINRVATELGVNPNDLAAAISFETGGTFNQKAKNPKSSATGLIQFMEATAKELGTSTAALSKMSFDQQMGYVAKYLKNRGVKKGGSLNDIYSAIQGVPKDGFRAGSTAYEQNKVWDSDHNGHITRGEAIKSKAFQQHVRDYGFDSLQPQQDHIMLNRQLVQQAQNRTNNTSSTSSVQISALHINTKATDAKGIAGDIQGELQVLNLQPHMFAHGMD